MATYQVRNGRVKVQIEDLLGSKPGGGWVYQAPGKGNNPGAEGAHYYYRSQTDEGTSGRTAPDAGRFGFKVNVQDPGTYSILLRASRDDATPGDSRNDIWIRVDGNIENVMPKGTPPLSMGGDGFAKYKSAPPEHKWVDAKWFSTPGPGNEPSDVVLSKGVHTITFAPRSIGYHIDSVQVIKKSGLNATALDLDATPVAKPEPEDDGPGVARSSIAVGIAARHDDFEANKAAASDDLELGRDGAGAQSVGLRFEADALDPAAGIESAYFVFQAAETSQGAARLAIEIEDTTEAKSYSKGDAPDARAYHDEAVTWNVEKWTEGRSYQSADISALIEAVIEEGGAEAIEALAFRVSGFGARVAAAFESDGQAPELVITYA